MTRDRSGAGIALNTSRAGRMRPARVWARSSESCAAAGEVSFVLGLRTPPLWVEVWVVTLLMQEERKGAGGGRAIGGDASARRTNGEDGVAATNGRMDKARARVGSDSMDL
jgi:hypothetical protein